MPSASINYVKLKLSVDTVTFTPVVAPFDCRGLSMRNLDLAAAFKVRTDSADPNTEDTVAAGVQEIVTTAYTEGSGGGGGGYGRFRRGAAICFIQAVSGVGPIMLTFVM